MDRDLDPDTDVISATLPVRRLCGATCQRPIVAWCAGVDQPLNPGSVGHAQRDEEKGEGDAQDGAEGDAAAVHEREEDVLNEWAEDDACDRVQRLDCVVGYA